MLISVGFVFADLQLLCAGTSKPGLCDGDVDENRGFDSNQGGLES